jgi:hypothetical protein
MGVVRVWMRCRCGASLIWAAMGRSDEKSGLCVGHGWGFAHGNVMAIGSGVCVQQQ